jgi:hypothetical protein
LLILDLDFLGQQKVRTHGTTHIKKSLELKKILGYIIRPRPDPPKIAAI